MKNSSFATTLAAIGGALGGAAVLALIIFAVSSTLKKRTIKFSPKSNTIAIKETERKGTGINLPNIQRNLSRTGVNGGQESGKVSRGPSLFSLSHSLKRESMRSKIPEEDCVALNQPSPYDSIYTSGENSEEASACTAPALYSAIPAETPKNPKDIYSTIGKGSNKKRISVSYVEPTEPPPGAVLNPSASTIYDDPVCRSPSTASRAVSDSLQAPPGSLYDVANTDTASDTRSTCSA